MSNQFIEQLKTQRERLAALTASREGWDDIKSWHTSTRILVEHLAPQQMSHFESLREPSWCTLPRGFVGRESINPHADSDEANINRDIAENAKKELLALLDSAISFCEVNDAPTGSDTKQSDVIFDAIDSIIVNSHLAKRFRDVIAQDLLDARLAFKAGAFKATVVMLGAALEGVMLGTLQRSDVLSHLQTMNTPPRAISNLGTAGPGLDERIGDLGFDTFRQCIHALIPDVDKLKANDMQSFRNAIHPWEVLRQPSLFRVIDATRALQYITSLKIITEWICRWSP